MRFALALPCLLLFAMLTGCGGSTDSSGSTTSTTTTTTTTTTGTGTSTFSTSADAGSYSGTFSGSRSGANYVPENYTGTGTGSIQSTGSATFAYTATATNGLTVSQSFQGTISSSGVFSGATSFAPSGGGAIINYAATGQVTQVSTTQITVALTWSFPYATGGNQYTATETWTLTKQ